MASYPPQQLVCAYPVQYPPVNSPSQQFVMRQAYILAQYRIQQQRIAAARALDQHYWENLINFLERELIACQLPPLTDAQKQELVESIVREILSENDHEHRNNHPLKDQASFKGTMNHDMVSSSNNQGSHSPDNLVLSEGMTSHGGSRSSTRFHENPKRRQSMSVSSSLQKQDLLMPKGGSGVGSSQLRRENSSSRDTLPAGMPLNNGASKATSSPINPNSQAKIQRRKSTGFFNWLKGSSAEVSPKSYGQYPQNNVQRSFNPRSTVDLKDKRINVPNPQHKAQVGKDGRSSLSYTSETQGTPEPVYVRDDFLI